MLGRNAAHALTVYCTHMCARARQANEQLLGGPKAALVARCVDGELRGGLPACPSCGVARLHVSYERPGAHGEGEGRARYACPGYFDNEAKTFVRWCGYALGRMHARAMRRPVAHMCASFTLSFFVWQRV
jgi:hypothetical protein